MSSAYRKRCLNAKGVTCELCPLGEAPDAPEDVIVHHIDGDRSNDDLDNLLPVCQSCHAKIHHGSSGYEELFEKLPDRSRIGYGGNVKDMWNHTMVYLPQSVHDRIEDQYNYLQYKTDFKVMKTRHLYPLIIEVGLKQIEEMDVEEVKSLLREIDRDLK